MATSARNQVYSKFLASFRVDRNTSGTAENNVEIDIVADGATGFLKDFSGASFNKGLYRVQRTGALSKWNTILVTAFPEFENRIFGFAYDWLGRYFALDRQRLRDGEPLVLVLEPGTGEVLEIPTTFIEFHNDELVGKFSLIDDFYRIFMVIEPNRTDVFAVYSHYAPSCIFY